MRGVRLLGRYAWRAVATVAALGVFLVAGRVLLGGTEVRAATDTYYPQFCLGGWEHPRAASGEPETNPGDDGSAFTGTNSAFLAPDTSAQIFCGYFPVEDRANPPVSAHIRLILNLDGADDASSPPVATPPPPAPPSAPEETSPPAPEPETTPLPAEPASTGTGAPTSAEPASPMPEAAPEHAAPAPSSATTEQKDAAAPPVPDTDQSPAETSPVPAPPAVPADAPTSLLGEPARAVVAWIRAHTSIAHAQEDTASVALSLSDWFEVSYSLDGVRWKSIGRVNASNWRDFTVTVPLSSWEDLRNVQIMVAALPSLTDRPSAYLDGLELRVETDPTFAESATAAAGAASDILDSAIDTVLSLLPGHEDPQPQQAVVEQPAPEQVPVAKAKKRVLQFTVRGKPLPALTQLPWQDAAVRETLASTTQTAAPDIARSDDGRSFIVSGSCNSAYAVVIAYPEADDYLEHPRNALVNVATPCESGHYTFNLGLLPESTRSGTFYLLIGAQGETGTWTPASALLPITIDPVEIEE